MKVRTSQGSDRFGYFSFRHLYILLLRRPYSAIMFGAIFCTLVVKLFHSFRVNLPGQFFSWILADVAVLLAIEIVLVICCYHWPRRWVIRVACIVAAVVCTWSVMNAGWLMRTGTQILPTVLLPLFRDPLNSCAIIGYGLVRMPVAAVILLGPSGVALAFLFYILARPHRPRYRAKKFARRTSIVAVIVVGCALGRVGMMESDTERPLSSDLRYNVQLRAVANLVLSSSELLTNNHHHDNATRIVAAFDQVQIGRGESAGLDYNIVVVVLEGVQYRFTSLYDEKSTLTPYLVSLAKEGVEFSNTHSAVTHTTKVLFSLLTGKFPSVSQDISETVPVEKPYSSLATILKEQAGYRTAFFQSAKGNFEARPGLVHNLGFDKFWARENLDDPNAFLGSLGSDEFRMIEPISQWIREDSEKPFLLTVLCSVTHDPYVVPRWFAEPVRDPVERYRQAIRYTDDFIAKLDAELKSFGLKEKTIFCVIGDHGEAFGEHGLSGHERIEFEEALSIPFCLRCPGLLEPGVKVAESVSSIDLTPTLLTLLGYDIKSMDFDGLDALNLADMQRRVYFSGWLWQSPAGFIESNRKYVYNPSNQAVYVYDLRSDPLELTRLDVSQQQAVEIANDVLTWRENSVFKIIQTPKGEKKLYDNWSCRWEGRICLARYNNHSED